MTCFAKRSEQSDSFADAAVGDRLTKSSVLPSPESAGWSRNVSRESRYGTWLRFALSEAKTPASAESDLLIDWASSVRPVEAPRDEVQRAPEARAPLGVRARQVEREAKSTIGECRRERGRAG